MTEGRVSNLAYPRLWRSVGLTLSVALAANTLLASVVVSEVPLDVYEVVVSVASGLAVVWLWVTRFRLVRYLASAFALSFFVWMANLWEFALEAEAGVYDRFRQCGFYLAFALLSLAGYLAVSVARRED